MGIQRELSVTSEDGFALPVTKYSANNRGPVVIITSAVAVPRKIYKHFAQHLLAQGASHVYTYDFRGLGGQQLENDQLKSISMMDWAAKDFPAIVDFVRHSHPDETLLGVGHSFGSQVLGMGEKHHLFSKYMGIACGSGYINLTQRPYSLKMKMAMLGWISLWFDGKIPAKYSLGTEFPTGVLRQWKKWSDSPDYMMSDPTAAAICQFEQVDIPIRFVGFSDDLYVTPKSLKALTSWYNKADLTTDWIDCDQLKTSIGHFGFFRKENYWLWPTQSKWLLEGLV